MGEAAPQDLKEALPALRWLTPGSEEFQTKRLTYCASNPAVPQAILCPRNADEVAAIVQLARVHNVPFSVRTGGHDLYGRSVVHDALCIDMRDINSVEVAADRKTAVIGGGVQFGQLLTDLHKHGLVTPHGSVPAIGYFGWASLGGYGCSSTNFGLGVDQIVEAQVVDEKGNIVNADEEMMRGIRGAGGNFGIVTRLRIKVYEVKKLLGGMLMFDTTKGISQVFKEVMLKIQDLEFQNITPREVVLQPLVINHPQAGRSFAVTYIWSSNDHDKGRKFLEQFIEQMPAPVLMNTVSEMSPPDWIYMLDQFVAKSAWGEPQAISFGKMTPRVLDIMGQNLEEMPTDLGTCFSLHSLAKQSPSITNPSLAAASCFNPEARQPHTLIEIVGSALSQEAMERCSQWGKSMRQALSDCGEAMQGSYVSLVAPGAMSLEDIYGVKFGELKALKQKYDPNGVFKYAVPRILD